MLHELYASCSLLLPFQHDINMAFIGSTVSGGESLKGWAGTQFPALFFCARWECYRETTVSSRCCAGRSTKKARRPPSLPDRIADAPSSPSTQRRLHEIGRALADHYARRIGVAADQSRHDTRIGDPQPVDAVQLQRRNDHRIGVIPHPARPDRVIDRVGAAAEERVERGIIVDRKSTRLNSSH